MNIVIVGAGEIGSHLATELSREAHNISVIEKDVKKAAELERILDAKVVAGDGTSVSALAEANIGECELFLALTSENTSNLMSASMAKSMGVPQVISRVHPGLQREEWLFDFRGHFGIDHLFSSERLAAIELSKFIRNPESITVEELAQGKIELQQLKISAKSDAAGVTLRDLKPPAQTRVAMVARNGKNEVPTADTRLKAGDIVTIFGEPRNLRDLAERLQKGNGMKDNLRVVIFGGGEYGFALAQMLESWHCKVRIFEPDAEVCRELTNKLSNTTVINADATSVAELEEEQVGQADFFVAVSASDEDNVMTCLQAHNLGAKNCLTLIHRADYARAISASGRHFGVMAAISPREAALREISRYITSEKYHVMKKIGEAELIQVRVASGSKVAGKKIRDISWPANSVIVGLVQGKQALVPGAEEVISSGNDLYVMVTKKSLRKFINLVL